MLTKPWHKLSTWFQSNISTPFETEHGAKLWEYACHEPTLNEIFNDGMASDAQLVSELLLDDKCKGVFEGLKSLVDVGGGTGTLAKAIAKSFPGLEFTVFDLPHVVAGLEGSDNLKYIAGDMFEVIPSSDAILLKWILHDWNDEECLKILKNCKEAIMSKGKGGKVIIIDMVIMEEEKKKCDDDTSVETQLFFDMLMMVLLAGKQRNEKEWAKLIFSAGFSNYKISPILGLRSLIEI
ncbi:putative O-methyltransferase 3 [Stylosanthes scabra]|uniref:O-methyltransferase 3 n=1 Tax=Stylosanthes scabra TaxID=79078 RepID=A0ABU6RUU3_9FABA|nr:putative O-methyltransferase 3 [Stylosanthes scabra]